MSSISRIKFLITCEHAGREIPACIKNLVSIPSDILNSHRGFDPGALALAETLSKKADAFYYDTCSRLVIELNRSIGHADLFSKYSESLDFEIKNQLIDEIYLPYREKVENKIAQWIAKNYQVIHLSVHSFTPVLNGVVRETDIGLLYDPERFREKNTAALFKQVLAHICPWRVRFNYPYLGKSDGLTTYLRKLFPEKYYLGLELETNQALWSAETGAVKQSQANLYKGFNKLRLALIKKIKK